MRNNSNSFLAFLVPGSVQVTPLTLGSHTVATPCFNISIASEWKSLVKGEVISYNIYRMFGPVIYLFTFSELVIDGKYLVLTYSGLEGSTKWESAWQDLSSTPVLARWWNSLVRLYVPGGVKSSEICCLYNSRSAAYWNNTTPFTIRTSLFCISLPLAYLQGMWSLLLQRVFNHPYTLVWWSKEKAVQALQLVPYW